MAIPQFDLTRQNEAIRDEVAAAVERVLGGGRYIGGAEVEAFEREAAAYCDVQHAISCANGTDAITLVLTALDIGPGDEVIAPPFTFFGTVSPIVQRGATPVFADIDPESCCLDPEKVRAVITSRTAAIMHVHLYGRMAKTQALADIAAEAGVPLIEDAAQAIGARENGECAGSIGTAATFSFYPTKNLAAMGDGGMITTNDEALAQRLRELRNHGEREKYTHYEFGFNSRLDALQAAVLRVKLRHLDDWIERRRAIADEYDRLLTERSLAPRHITIPTRPMGDGETALHVFHQYTIRCAEREELRAHLAKRGVGSAVHYPRVIYRQPAFEKYDLPDCDCPNAERAAAEVLSLPMFPELTRKELEATAEAIEEFHR